METAYLEEASAGNIIKGFDSYIKNSTSSSVGGGGTGTSSRRKGGISDADRVFSRSSVSFARVGRTTLLRSSAFRVSQGTVIAITSARLAARRYIADSFMHVQDSPGPTSDAPPSGAPTPASSTVAQSARESNQPTPGGTTNGKVTAPKKKKTVDRDEEGEDGKPAKRGKITYARE